MTLIQFNHFNSKKFKGFLNFKFMVLFTFTFLIV